MNYRRLILAKCLMLLCASTLVAQVGAKVDPPKPNGPVNKVSAPSKAPPAFPNLPNLTVKEIKNLFFDTLTREWRMEVQVMNTGKADAPACKLGVKIDFVGGVSLAVRSLPTIQKGAFAWVTINMDQGPFVNSAASWPPKATLVTVMADPRFKYKLVKLGGNTTMIVFLKPGDPGYEDVNRNNPPVFESDETDNELALRPEQINKPKHQ